MEKEGEGVEREGEGVESEGEEVEREREGVEREGDGVEREGEGVEREGEGVEREGEIRERTKQRGWVRWTVREAVWSVERKSRDGGYMCRERTSLVTWRNMRSHKSHS